MDILSLFAILFNFTTNICVYFMCIHIYVCVYSTHLWRHIHSAPSIFRTSWHYTYAKKNNYNLKIRSEPAKQRGKQYYSHICTHIICIPVCVWALVSSCNHCFKKQKLAEKDSPPIWGSNLVVVVIFLFVTHTLRCLVSASVAYLCLLDLFCLVLFYHKFLYANWIHKSIRSRSFILSTAASNIVHPSRLSFWPPHDCQFLLAAFYPLPMTDKPVDSWSPHSP